MPRKKRNRRPSTKKRPGRSRKKKAIQNVKSLRAKIAALEALNQKLKARKPRKRKPCNCKKTGNAIAKVNTSKPRNRSKKRAACPPPTGKRRKNGFYKRAKKAIKNFAGFKV